jgi:hypothetical protein
MPEFEIITGTPEELEKRRQVKIEELERLNDLFLDKLDKAKKTCDFIEGGGKIPNNFKAKISLLTIRREAIGKIKEEISSIEDRIFLQTEGQKTGMCDPYPYMTGCKKHKEGHYTVLFTDPETGEEHTGHLEKLRDRFNKLMQNGLVLLIATCGAFSSGVLWF